MTDDLPLLPGATLGILGGGQLGRMLAMEAHRMGYRVHVYDPVRGGPASQVADLETNAPFEDAAALRAFFDAVDVVTFEFENIPTQALGDLRSATAMHPKVDILRICQDRLLEKDFVASVGVPLAEYEELRSFDDLERFLETHPAAVIKTARSGYDGKGQCKVKTGDDALSIWKLFEGKPAVIERLVSFEAEVSAIVARTPRGERSVYPIARNVHVNHILDATTVPAALDESLAKRAAAIAERLAEGLGLVGVLCVEMFVEDGKLLVNELAPRPHNSGHYTIDACATNQFEQQLRAVMGLPLGSPALLAPRACMLNLMGDLWNDGEPRWDRLLAEDVRLHLYGKSSPRPGRKMGHVTAIGSDPTEVLARCRRAKNALA